MTDPNTSWAQPEGRRPAPEGSGPTPAPQAPVPPGYSAAPGHSQAPQGYAPAPQGNAEALQGYPPRPQPSGVPPVVPPRKSGSSRATNALLVVAALVAVGGVAFAGGRLTAPTSASSGFDGTGRFSRGSFDPGQAGLPDASFQPGQGGQGGFGGFGGDRALTISGTVKRLDGSTLVITTADGQDVSIDVSGSAYHAQTAAAAEEVTTGTDVSVSVTGFGGSRGPNASTDPNAVNGAASIRATDVTITSK
jgi:hypothetical protein